MIFNDIKCIKIALLLCFVDGVVSNPKLDVYNEDRSNKEKPNGLNKKVNLPNLGVGQLDAKNKDGHKHQHEGDAEVGSIETNEEDIEGSLMLNHTIKQHVRTKPENKNQSIGGTVIENIKLKYHNGKKQTEHSRNVSNETNTRAKRNKIIDRTNDDGVGNEHITGDINVDDDGNIKGTINQPDEYDGKPDARYDNDDQGDKVDDVTGNINIDDDRNVDGTVNLPNDGGNSQSNAENDNKGQGNDTDIISGEIDIDNDGNIGGNINIPDDKPGAGNDNKGQGGDADIISGEINIGDDGNIEGNVNIPDDGGDGQSNAGNDNKGQGNDTDIISGEIDIDDDGNIEGNVNIPDDKPGAGNDNKGQGGDSDVISGEINIGDDGNIEGNVNVLDDGENGKLGAGNDNKDQIGDKDTITDNNENEDCWMDLKTKPYLVALDEIDAKYSKARRQYHDEIGPEFNKNMMQVLLSTQGKAPRAIHQAQGNHNIIPAGLNLGGFGMMRMAGSMLRDVGRIVMLAIAPKSNENFLPRFFHRLKLRNSTIFRVDFLEANLMDMSLVARLSLNDLHLQGSYERATTEGGKSVLYFLPSYGELDVLMRSVNYKMEGRLRMLNNRLMIEVINSDIITRDILLSYANSTATAINTAFESIEDFVSRMKCDLDIWLKDYFNDYLMYFGIVGGGKNSDIQLYEKEKTIKANEYADHAIKGIKKHLRKLKAANVRLPSFTLLSALNHRIELKNGILRGLDSIYRRSVAMTKKDNSIRVLDMMIGFSNLKVEYKYEATVVPGTPPLAGLLMLTSDELSARLQISQVQDSKVLDMNVDSILQLKSESLTVEGPANRLIADFKFLLENAIIAIMTNVMKHNVKMLKTLTRCEPDLWGEVTEFSQYFNDNNNTGPNNVD